MVKEIGGQKNGRGPRRLHPARPDGENDWRPDLVARAADLARWQRATRPIMLAINLIHHPDEPDGVETRDTADHAGHQSDSPPRRARWGLEEVLAAQSGVPRNAVYDVTPVYGRFRRRRY
jgi:hypothetical protein